MPCTPGCGSCCDPVLLSAEAIDKAFIRFGPTSKQISWIWDNWQPLGPANDRGGVLLRCVNYDVENRACLVYESRPPVCSGYPFYAGQKEIANIEPDRLVCGYQAEVGRTVLPIVAVT